MPNPITGGRRSSIEIVREILAVCDSDGVNKTTIMYRSNLSYDQLRRYLSMLSDQDLIFKNDNGQFGITPRGQRMLKQVSSVLKALGSVDEGGKRKRQLRPQVAGATAGGDA